MKTDKATKQILNFDHELWDEFEDAMWDRPQCDGTTRSARSILENLAQDALIDIEGTLSWFEVMGGFCDCEIFLNVIRKRYFELRIGDDGRLALVDV